MQVKHTPGPWRIGNFRCVVADVPTTDRKGTGHSDTEYYGGYMVCESLSNISNARLIAAAPELLEALKLARDWLANSVPTLDMPGPRPLPVIEAAIAKAEGKSI